MTIPKSFLLDIGGKELLRFEAVLDLVIGFYFLLADGRLRDVEEMPKSYNGYPRFSSILLLLFK